MSTLSDIVPELNIDNNIVIIGSNTNVLNKELGYRIDQFNEVIRFNRAPIETYEQYIGSKTTIRVVNPGVFQCIKHKGWSEEGQPQNFIQEQENQHVIVVYRCHNQLTQHNKYSELLHTTSIGHRFSNFPPKDQSVGFIFLNHCIKNNIIPYIYGFGLDGGSSTSHYWENKPPYDTSHNYGYERGHVKEFIRMGKIKVLK